MQQVREYPVRPQKIHQTHAVSERGNKHRNREENGKDALPLDCGPAEHPRHEEGSKHRDNCGDRRDHKGVDACASKRRGPKDLPYLRVCQARKHPYQGKHNRQQEEEEERYLEESHAF